MLGLIVADLSDLQFIRKLVVVYNKICSSRLFDVSRIADKLHMIMGGDGILQRGSCSASTVVIIAFILTVAFTPCLTITTPDTDIDDCNPDPCMNGATCMDGINNYTCACVAGYTGANCSTNIDDCNPFPCMNDAICYDGIDSYTCDCVAGYTDANCSTDIDDCSPNPCMNGATCMDGITNYTCACVAGYSGDNCSIDIDDCSPGPCMNGATCMDGIDNYTCTCVDGYTDANCSTDIDDCSPDPCMNGATCMDGIHSFTCACVAGYTDTQCSTEIYTSTSENVTDVPTTSGSRQPLTTTLSTDTAGLMDSTTESGTTMVSSTAELHQTTTQSNPLVTNQTTTQSNSGINNQTTAQSNPVVTNQATTQSNPVVTDQTTTQSNSGINDQTTTQSNPVVTDQTTTQSSPGVTDQTTTQSSPGVTNQATTQSNPVVTNQATTQSNPVVTDQTTTQSNPVVTDQTTTQSNPVVTNQTTTQSNSGVTNQVTTQSSPVVTNQTTTQPSPVVTYQTTTQPSPVVTDQTTFATTVWQDDTTTETTTSSVVCPVPDLTVGLQVDGCTAGGEAGVDDVCTYSCISGYSISGDAMVTCRSDGTFSSAIPTCNAVTCAVPALTPGLVVNDCTPGGSTAYNTLCQYSCMAGYNINGVSPVTCGSDGSFSPDIPTCDIVTCAVPALTPGLVVNDCTAGGSADYNTMCQYSCSTGYTLNGVSPVTCGSDGSFSLDIPTCDKIIYIEYDSGLNIVRYYHRYYYSYSYLAYYTVTLDTGFPISYGRLYNYITFTSTGIINFSYYYPYRWTLWRYINPSTFSFFDQFYRDPAIAVFGAPVDLRRGNPRIYFQVYDRRYGSSSSLLTAVQERLDEALSLPAGLDSSQFINGINFILLITWENVQPPGSVHGYETNTYQAVLFTDGRRSGILTMYQEGSLRWNPYSKGIPARIGYNIKHDRQNIYQSNYPATRYASYRPDARIGNTGLMGRDIYRLDANDNLYINARRYCLDWYYSDLSRTPRWWRAQPCPCTSWQARRDRRFTRCNYPYYGYGFGYYGYGYGYGYGNNLYGLPNYYYDRRGTTCYQPRWPSWGGGYRCTYQGSALIRGYRSLWKSSHYQAVMPRNARFYFYYYYYFSYYYYSLSYYYSWIERDVLPRYYCCALAGRGFCNLYESRRPRSHCRGYRRPWFGWFWGDPHINTLDGRKYTFNGLGEYTTMAYNNGDPFMLQSRTGKAFNNSEPVEYGTVFTGFAATQGITRVEFQLNDNRTEMSILVNGSAINMTDFLTDGFDSEDETFILSAENDTASEDEIKATALFQTEDYPSTSFTVTFKNANLELGVMVPPEYAENGTGRGLLGNVNGDKTDDFLLRNGTLLMDQPGRNLTDREIFQFGQSWVVSESESLFEYGEGNWSYYNPPGYIPKFLDELLALDPAKTAAARAACGENEECLFDYLAVNPETGQQTMDTGNERDEDIQFLDNFPPNITDVRETSHTEALQEEDVLYMQVGVTVTLEIVAHDPNEDDSVSYSLNGTTPAGASISSNGTFTWTPPDVNVSSIEIIVSDTRGAETSQSFKVLICRCENNGGCEFETQIEGQDLDANGYAVVVCNCTDGWSGDHCDEDYDACEGSSSPCYEGVICYDEPPSSSEDYRCGPCPPQLTGDGTNCFDVNECEDNVTIRCDHVCENTLGSYMCSCNAGFTLGLDQHSCNEISPCDEALMNSTGSVNCTCDPGFELYNGTCTDFDECASGVDLCPRDISSCTNLPGDYNCTCHSGYNNSSPKECQDVDECKLSTHDCNSSSDRICFNTFGNFSCVCGENKTEINGTCESSLTLSLEVRFVYISGFNVEMYPTTIDSEEIQDQLAQDVLNYLNTSSSFGNDTLLAVSVRSSDVRGSYVLVSFRVDVEADTTLTSELAEIFMELLPSSRLIKDHQVMGEDINECELFEDDVCSNGNCTNTVGSFFCTCNDGFQLSTGNDSCIDINECLVSHNCSQICSNSPGSFSCACRLGYEIDNDTVTCVDIDECATDPCANGATCMEGINTYNCTCVPGYTGTNCETNINECASTPCANGATCMDLVNEYECSCLAGYNGINCETDIDECASGPCANGASCFEGINLYNCTCYPGYTGINCEIDINECDSDPCVSGATCLDRINMYECSCIPGYTGTNCETDIDECASNPCQNEGSCTEGRNSFTCTCPVQYTGYDCSEASGRDGSGLSVGALVGIVLGAIAGAVCLALGALLIKMALSKTTAKITPGAVEG